MADSQLLFTFYLSITRMKFHPKGGLTLNKLMVTARMR